MRLKGFLLAIFIPVILFASDYKAVYKSLDPTSIIQNLTFYELYPDTTEGKEALKKSWQLLSQTPDITPLTLPSFDLQFMIKMVNSQSYDSFPSIKDEELKLIEKLGHNLANRKLKGHNLWEENQILALPKEEIDLSRALFIVDTNNDKKKICFYEAILDLMALQIKARLKDNATALDKIFMINNFIFYEMEFRFPPHSIYAKNIDTFTFLSSVIDNRKGVCLGVSILYLCLAQRLDLPLEIVTPPGHIYVRYNDNGNITNIETTARGIHIDTENYLGIDTRKSQMRNIKEVVGLALMNQASAVWTFKEDYKTAVNLYKQAIHYIPDDMMLQEFLAYNLLFTGQEKEAKKILQKTKNFIADYAVCKDTLADDYLNGLTDIDGIKALFLSVDENRESILKKQDILQKVVKKHPKFRSGILQLASTYMQLGRLKESLDILKKYEAIDGSDATVNYYLAAICAERFNYPDAWLYLKKAEEITKSRNHTPKALKSLKTTLKIACPNY
jgi:regulator of sirC expression with transglutaminase-like and TPR domain